jgi:hypothetical protein
MAENYTRSGKDLSDLASVQKYLVDTQRDRAVSVVNAMLRDADPTDYAALRFGLASTLLTDAFFSCDFGSRYHGETVWFDEYSVMPSGEVSAATTTLRAAVDASQDRLPVVSTASLPAAGVVWIDGEQIYCAAKDDDDLLECTRGYPRATKYDLRRAHTAGARVISYRTDATGYLGAPISGAYAADDPSVKLADLFAETGWFASETIAAEIDGRVWRRDFEHGMALLNPSPETRTAAGLGDGVYRKIVGLQDPAHNDGQVVEDRVVLDGKDGLVLVRIL